MIRTKNISFEYQNGASLQFQDFESSQEPLLILGPSGCGKTTLLHLLAGLITPKEGEIYWDNQSIKNYSRKELDKQRALQIGLIFQKPHFISALNVAENIMIQAKLSGKAIDQSQLDELMERLSILSLKNKKITALSEGEKQRVSIARALICKPKYILADEPTSSLDDKNAVQVIDLLITESSRHNAQVMIITHDQRLKDKINHKVELK